jgi:fluoride exporter
MNGLEWLAVFIGGGLGSLARLGMGRWVGLAANDFPWSTLLINLAACLVLGFASGMAAGNKETIHPVLRIGITTGFCGGFSTFSTFSLESVDLVSNGKILLCGAYVLASVSLCFVGIWLGQAIGRRIM